MLPRLLALERQIIRPALRRFVGEVLADDEMALRLLKAPASLKHHHQQPGGLLDHAVEVAEIARAIPRLADAQRDIATVGGLFHDVGKTRTNEEGAITTTGSLISHDDLTLELCAGALRTLDRSWKEAATTLRHIWTCASPGARYGEPQATVLAEVVRFADRFSAGLDKERQAFAAVGGEPALIWRFGDRLWTPGPEPLSDPLPLPSVDHAA